MKAAGRILLVLGIKRFRGGPKVSATAAGSPVPLSLRDVLKISGFKRLWLAQLVSILGDFLAVFGVINLITFKWHGTPLQVTNVMIAFIIPMAIVGPLAGVFVDRWNVKRTMIISDLIRAALILGLVFVTRLEQIYVLFFLVSTVSSCFSPLISVYVRDQLHAGTRAFGIISAMVGVGLILGTQVVNAVAKGFSKKYVALSGLFGLSFATFVLALFQTPWLAGVSMFGIGFAIAFIVVPAQTLMQQETPHDMLGRVSSSFMAVFSLSQLLGLLLSGGLANSIGVRHLFTSSAVLLVVLSGIGFLWLRDDKPAEEKAVAAAGS